MADLDFDPSSDSTFINGARLFRHVLTKGFQFGSVIGLGLVMPAAVFLHKRKGGAMTVAELAPKLLLAQSYAAAGGVALSAVAGTARVMKYEDKKAAFEDRAYRLHYNKSQNRADLFAQAGMAACGIAAAATLGTAAPILVGAASAGAAVGILGHVVTYRPPEKSPNAMLHEL